MRLYDFRNLANRSSTLVANRYRLQHFGFILYQTSYIVRQYSYSKKHKLLVTFSRQLCLVYTTDTHGRNHWGVGGPDLPKIWTDPLTFYIAF